MGTFPNFSTIYPRIKEKLDQRGGNNSPMNKNGTGGVSGLTPWIRIISSTTPKGTSPTSSVGGLVLQSIHNGDSFTARYGNYEYKDGGGKTIEEKSGILGYQLDMKTPVTVPGRPLRPSPLVNALSIDEADIGKRKISFNIIAYTLEHMEALSSYFLEPGFYLLMEWGWNTTAARSQWVGKENPGGAITPCDIAKYNKWQHIANKRANSDYDYDATLGVITGGSIEFGDNETYTLKVECTSIGEVAEYMQTHKDASSSTNKRGKSGKIFSPQNIQALTEDVKNNPVGNALFAQMVNSLPSSKQTYKVKELREAGNKLKVKLEGGDTKKMFVDQSSYVNMDLVILDNLISNWGRASGLRTRGGEELKIPSNEPIISEEKFIRFELAIDILNSYSAELKANRPMKDNGCTDAAASLEINIDDCVCSAFPHMWSTDKTKLYIPNVKAPAFGILDAFSGTDAKTDFINFENLDENTQNLHPKTVFGYYSGTRAKNGEYGNNWFGYTRKVPHAFPSNYELTDEDNSWNTVDKTFIPYNAPKGWWGWLKNLYINFDFFCEVIQTPNYTQRDVFYDLLNGMSGAVNSLWKFQIVERPNRKTGKNELQVVDLNFTGDISKVVTRNDGIKTFQSRGTKSPFLAAGFSVTVPASTMNSTIQKRLSNDANYTPNPDVNPVPILGSVFGSNKTQDSVGTVISAIQWDDVGKDEKGKPIPNPPTPKEHEVRLANYEFFLGKAGVFPKIQYRTDRYDILNELHDLNTGNDAVIEDVLMVGTWADTLALQQVFNIDKGIDSALNSGKPKDINTGEGSGTEGSGKKGTGKEGTGKEGTGKDTLNAPYGMATFDFKVHGISGFKRGDILRIDGLPKKFSDPHFFQVDGIEHSIDSSGWVTSVKTGLRPGGKNKE